MTMISLGDLAQQMVLRRQTTSLKSAVQTAGSEVTTGRTADAAARLRGDIGPIAAIEASLARLKAHATANTHATLRAAGQQAALGAIDTSAKDLQKVLLQAVAGGGATLVEAGAEEARQRFSSAVSALNGRAGDRSLFSGVEVQGAALAPADTILAALRAAVSGAATAPEAEAAVADWFARPDGFAAVAWQGGAAPAPVTVADGETVRLDLTANDPSIKATLEALALSAVLADGGGPDAPGERLALARRSAERLADDARSRGETQGRLGTAEAAIEAARTRNAAETTALGIASNDLLGVDDYDAATRLENTQTQLETLYAVTARLSRLSLVDFLR